MCQPSADPSFLNRIEKVCLFRVLTACFLIGSMAVYGYTVHLAIYLPPEVAAPLTEGPSLALPLVCEGRRATGTLTEKKIWHRQRRHRELEMQVGLSPGPTQPALGTTKKGLPRFNFAACGFWRVA